jgi:hypothetical protein
MNNLRLDLTYEQAQGLMSCLIRTNARGKDLDVGEMIEGKIVEYYDQCKDLLNIQEEYIGKKYKNHYVNEHDEFITVQDVIQDPCYPDLFDEFLIIFSITNKDGTPDEIELMHYEVMDAIEDGRLIEIKS